MKKSSNLDVIGHLNLCLVNLAAGNSYGGIRQITVNEENLINLVVCFIDIATNAKVC